MKSLVYFSSFVSYFGRDFFYEIGREIERVNGGINVRESWSYRRFKNLVLGLSQ